MCSHSLVVERCDFMSPQRSSTKLAKALLSHRQDTPGLTSLRQLSHFWLKHNLLWGKCSNSQVLPDPTLHPSGPRASDKSLWLIWMRRTGPYGSGPQTLTPALSFPEPGPAQPGTASSGTQTPFPARSVQMPRGAAWISPLCLLLPSTLRGTELLGSLASVSLADAGQLDPLSLTGQKLPSAQTPDRVGG